GRARVARHDDAGNEAALRMILQHQAAAVFFRRALGDGQTQTVARRGLVRRAIEGFAQLRQMLFAHAGTMVTYADEQHGI
nr:hypothetical protein [Tanacetum cinerariifolium]